MTIVIQSKNGEPFLPSCLKHLKKNTSDAKIVLVDNGWENAAFLDRMVDEFQIEVLKNPHGDVNYAWMDVIVDIDSMIFTMHDSMFIQSPKYFEDLKNLDTDMRAWIVLRNQRIGVTRDVINEMLNFLPETLWTLPGDSFSMGYYSMDMIKAFRSDKKILEFINTTKTPMGHVAERVFASYMNVEYGFTSSHVNIFEEIKDIHFYRGMKVLRTDTAIKYNGSYLLGNREHASNLKLFED